MVEQQKPNRWLIRSRVTEATNEGLKRAFISTLEQVHTVGVAARLIGVDRSTLYKWRKEDNSFAAKWDEALEYTQDALESAAYLKLAQTYNDRRRRLSMPEERLTEFMLTGMKPEKYRQRPEIEVTTINITIDWSKVPDDVLDQYNHDLLTLQDVYEWTLLHKEPEAPASSETGRTEGISAQGTTEATSTESDT